MDFIKSERKASKSLSSAIRVRHTQRHSSESRNMAEDPTLRPKDYSPLSSAVELLERYASGHRFLVGASEKRSASEREASRR